MGTACSKETAQQPVIQKEPSHDSLAPLIVTSNKMSGGKNPLSRTVSVMKKAEQEKQLERNPHMEDVFKSFTEAKSFISESINHKSEPGDHDDFEEELHTVLHKKVIDKFLQFSSDEQRRMMGDNLAEIKFHKPLLKLYEQILENHELFNGISPSLDDEDGDEPYYEAIRDIRTIIWNFTDTSKEFAICIAEKTDLFEWLVKDLQITLEEGLDNLTDEEFSFNSAVAIITNCGRSGIVKSLFNVKVKNCNDKGETTSTELVHMVDVLTPFLKSKAQMVKLTTLVALSYMVTEEQNEFLTADESLFDFLLEMIEKALLDKDRRHEGFSVHELIDGLAGLAKNEDNKLIIMSKSKTYPMLKKLITKKSSDEETLASVRAIWELAFHGKNKQTFLKDKELMKHLEDLQHHPNEDIANSSGRALFVINPEKEDKKAKEKKTDIGVKGEHIMISYNWGNQKIVLELRDRLRENNFQVWIDVDFMEGSVLQMMATAIEKAAVVLICYSEKYKESKNCRTEAEYAYQRNKVVVPVLLQKGYKPDGWLGILIGTKLFYDFSGKYNFEQKFSEMKFSLDGMFTEKKQEVKAIKQSGTVAAAPPKDEDLFLLTWTKHDVENWLQQNDLQAFSGLKSLSGEVVGFLYKLFRKAPDYFYKCLEEKLGLKSLEDLMKFDRALERLSQQHPEINKLL